MRLAVTDPARCGVLSMLMRANNVRKLNSILGRLLFTAVLLATTGACSTLSSTAPVSVSGEHPMALLPFENLSVTPLADTQLQRLVETELRRVGVGDVYTYEPVQQPTLKALLSPQRQIGSATRWASEQGAQYAFTGTVHEWQYKGGADREPVVGLTLSLIDLRSGDVLWQANAARTGWGYANLSAVAERTVSELLEQITFSGSRATSRSVSSTR